MNKRTALPSWSWGTYLLLGLASRLVDWVLVLFGLPRVLLLILLGRLKNIDKSLLEHFNNVTNGAIVGV